MWNEKQSELLEPNLGVIPIFKDQAKRIDLLKESEKEQQRAARKTRRIRMSMNPTEQSVKGQHGQLLL